MRSVFSEVMFDQKISGEVPEHRDFIYQQAQTVLWKTSLACKFTVLRSDKTYDDVFHHIITRGPHEGRAPRFCLGRECARSIGTAKCLRSASTIRLNSRWTPVSYVGIALDEPKRLARLDKENEGQPSCKVWHDGSGCLAGSVREIRYALSLIYATLPNETAAGSARTQSTSELLPHGHTVTLTMFDRS